VAQTLNEWTAPSRERNAAALYLLGPMRPRPYDGVVTRAYFALTAFVWAEIGTGDEHLDALLSGLAGCGEPRRVLDVGMGAGHSSAALAERWPGAEVTGVDLSGAMVRAARSLHQARNLSFRRSSTARLPFPDSFFDMATVLNAVPDLDELRRVLQPGGDAVVASSFHDRPSPEDGGVISARWLQAGFDHVEGSEVPHGHWDRYRRR